MCGIARPGTAPHTRMVSSDGRRSNRMAMQSHPPFHLRALFTISTTSEPRGDNAQWLSDSAVSAWPYDGEAVETARKNLGLLC
jgi:hypothetical protein